VGTAWQKYDQTYAEKPYGSAWEWNGISNIHNRATGSDTDWGGYCASGWSLYWQCVLCVRLTFVLTVGTVRQVEVCTDSEYCASGWSLYWQWVLCVRLTFVLTVGIVNQVYVCTDSGYCASGWRLYWQWVLCVRLKFVLTVSTVRQV
jgi:hypothetical protein